MFYSFIKVCDVYHLHRETYHLSIAYIDQYLCRTKNFSKQKFQLLGITSLFVAAKIEVSFDEIKNRWWILFFFLFFPLGNLSTTFVWLYLCHGQRMQRRRYSWNGIGSDECKIINFEFQSHLFSMDFFLILDSQLVHQSNHFHQLAFNLSSSSIRIRSNLDEEKSIQKTLSIWVESSSRTHFIGIICQQNSSKFKINWCSSIEKFLGNISQCCSSTFVLLIRFFLNFICCNFSY